MDSFRLSEGLVLRELNESDADELHALIDANRTHLARWMPWAADQSREGTLEFIRTAAKQSEADEGFQVALVLEGRIAGGLGYHALDRSNRRVNIGYWIAERQQGRGLMTRAVNALVEHALGTWKLHRVEIRVAVANHRSRAVCERLGFFDEGILREAERLGGHYHDVVVYSVLAPEWRAHT